MLRRVCVLPKDPRRKYVFARRQRALARTAGCSRGFSACSTFSAFELRACYGFTSRTCYLRALYTFTYVHERMALCLRESFFLKIRTHRTQADLTEQVRAPHLQRTVCALTKIQHPNSGRNERTFVALAQRANKNAVPASLLQRTVCGLCTLTNYQQQSK